MERKSDYFYLKALPVKVFRVGKDEKIIVENHVHRIGIMGIYRNVKGSYAVTGVLCGLSNNFNSGFAKHVYNDRLYHAWKTPFNPMGTYNDISYLRKKSVTLTTSKMLLKIPISGFMRKLKIFRPARERNIDISYCKKIWNRIIDKILKEEKDGKAERKETPKELA